MVDSAEQLDFVDARSAAGGPRRSGSASTWTPRCALLGGRVHLGPRRSPVHAADDAAALARGRRGAPGLRLVGLMALRGPDRRRRRQRRRAARCGGPRSARCSARPRPSCASGGPRSSPRSARWSPLEFVNGGGTGSLEATGAEDAVTELAAGSGLYSPRAVRHLPRVPARARRVLRAVRRPPAHARTAPPCSAAAGSPRGRAGKDRLPTPAWPGGAAASPRPRAPARCRPRCSGPAAADLRVGDRVWFRHAKAGELCEHVDELHLVRGGAVVDVVPTYRGEGRAFL